MNSSVLPMACISQHELCSPCLCILLSPSTVGREHHDIIMHFCSWPGDLHPFARPFVIRTADQSGHRQNWTHRKTAEGFTQLSSFICCHLERLDVGVCPSWRCGSCGISPRFELLDTTLVRAKGGLCIP